MWLDKCWALRGHAIVWFASATFNGLSTRPDKLPICPIFWGSLTSEELETLSGAGLGRGFSWIFARHVRVPIFLSCKDRSTKPIGRAMFLGLERLCSQAATPGGAMPYPVLRRIEDQIPSDEALSGAAKKRTYLVWKSPGKSKPHPAERCLLGRRHAGSRTPQFVPSREDSSHPSIIKFANITSGKPLTRKAPVKSLSSIVPRSDSHVPNHRQFRPYAKPIPQSRDRVSSALAQSV